VMDQQLPDLQVLRKCWPTYRDPSTTHQVVVKGVPIGGPETTIIAGPCAVESYEHSLKIGKLVSAAGVRLMRGGVYKPRTSPHSFQGLGAEGLEILTEVRRQTGLGIVTEVMDPRLVDKVAEHVDMLQIGSRSMQNFPLLTEVGRTRMPILLKRGWSATVEEWLCAAEYIAKEGNDQIVLCERGIRASCHSAYSRNILDLNVLEPLRRVTPLPVVVDPSHATGHWSLVAAMSRTALAAGAHGLLVEVVESMEQRANLNCDAEQGITPEILTGIVSEARRDTTLGTLVR